MASIFVNGVNLCGVNISIQHGRVIVDGKKVDTGDAKTINIEVHGNIDTLSADACDQVKVAGSVGKVKVSAGDVTCGDVLGDVSSQAGDIHCGDVQGKVSTVAGDIRRR